MIETPEMRRRAEFRRMEAAARIRAQLAKVDDLLEDGLTAVPVLAEPIPVVDGAPSSGKGCREARESIKPSQLGAYSDSRGGSQKFDRKAYMREYMRKRRAVLEQKL